MLDGKYLELVFFSIGMEENDITH